MNAQGYAQACACEAFASGLDGLGPFGDLQALLSAARFVWWQQVPVIGWLAAIAAHPRLGRLEKTETTTAEFMALSKGEQAGITTAPTTLLQELAQWQERYELKFGHTFLLCAAGRSAEGVLASLKGRFDNPPAQELMIAAGEQMKITELRLTQLWRSHHPDDANTVAPEAEWAGDGRSPITSHVLDIARGSPASGVQIDLELEAQGSGGLAWCKLGSGLTNTDGRVPNLLPATHHLRPGCYRVTFHMAEYMSRCREAHADFYPKVPFYPQAEVRFTVGPDQTQQHFHIPLTWSPYGYSTYRGS